MCWHDIGGKEGHVCTTYILARLDSGLVEPNIVAQLQAGGRTKQHYHAHRTLDWVVMAARAGLLRVEPAYYNASGERIVFGALRFRLSTKSVADGSFVPWIRVYALGRTRAVFACNDLFFMAHFSPHTAPAVATVQP